MWAWPCFILASVVSNYILDPAPPLIASVSFLGLYSLNPFLYLNALLSVNMRGLFSALSSNITCLGEHFPHFLDKGSSLPVVNHHGILQCGMGSGSWGWNSASYFCFFFASWLPCYSPTGCIRLQGTWKAEGGKKGLMFLRIVFDSVCVTLAMATGSSHSTSGQCLSLEGWALPPRDLTYEPPDSDNSNLSSISPALVVVSASHSYYLWHLRVSLCFSTRPTQI